MDTEPVNTAVAGDLSVSAPIIAFALLGACEPDSARPFLNTPAAFARSMPNGSARSDFLESSLACDARRSKGWRRVARVKPRGQETASTRSELNG